MNSRVNHGPRFRPSLWFMSQTQLIGEVASVPPEDFGMTFPEVKGVAQWYLGPSVGAKGRNGQRKPRDWTPGGFVRSRVLRVSPGPLQVSRQYPSPSEDHREGEAGE